jgi:cytoskeletal protein CcmA (bactofilin family)
MLTRKDPNEADRNSGELNTIIGRGSVIEGTLTVQSSLRVDGKIIGTVQVADSLIVGKDGEIEGEVRVKNAVIGGKVKNKIIASGKVVLEAKSAVYGEVKTSRLVIDEGAIFEGKCTMGEEGKSPLITESASNRSNRPLGIGAEVTNRQEMALSR